MKPTPQQERSLKKYLRNTLAYRETYEEVYDHIISSLALQSGNKSFEEAVNQIVNSDFGGAKALVLMENNRAKLTEITIKKQYRKCCLNYLKFPFIFYVAAFSFACYYLISQIKLTALTLAYLFGPLVLIPFALQWIRYYKTGVIFGDTKASLNDRVFLKLSGLPLRFFWTVILGLLLLNRQLHLQIDLITPFFVSAALTVTVIFTVSLFKLSNQEFKPYAKAKS